jgi:hypothetical protein
LHTNNMMSGPCVTHEALRVLDVEKWVNRIRLILFHTNNRIFRPYLTQEDEAARNAVAKARALTQEALRMISVKKWVNRIRLIPFHTNNMIFGPYLTQEAL